MHNDSATGRVDGPIDTHLEPATPGRLTRLTRLFGGQAPMVAVVAGGGGIGAAARHGAGLLWPSGTAAFPWTTLLINLTGCALIGLLLVFTVEVWAAHRLVVAFLGTGVLGGFTTFPPTPPRSSGWSTWPRPAPV